MGNGSDPVQEYIHTTVGAVKMAESSSTASINGHQQAGGSHPSIYPYIIGDISHNRNVCVL